MKLSKRGEYALRALIDLRVAQKPGRPLLLSNELTNDEAIAMAHCLAKEEGILAGISTRANMFAAIEVARRPENKGKLIVTIGCSTGERYLSTALAEDARHEVSGK